jgi:hypothetical protein
MTSGKEAIFTDRGTLELVTSPRACGRHPLSDERDPFFVHTSAAVDH